MRQLQILLTIVIVCCTISVHAQKNQDSKLYHLEDISHIDTIHLHTFYKIKKYCKGVNDGVEYVTSFENGDSLIYQLFVVYPVYDASKGHDFSAEDTLMMFQNEDFSYREFLGLPVNNKIYAYVGHVFEKAIDKKLTASQKQIAQDNFIKNARKECSEMSWKKKTEYFERLSSGYQYDCYVKTIKLTAEMKPIIFIPKYVPFK